jgi:hypothetical protein
MSSAKEIENYRSLLDSIVADSKEEFVFPNEGVAHMALALDAMFRYGEGEFLMYDDRLEGDVVRTYPLIVESMRNFIYRGGSMKFIFKLGHNKHYVKLLEELDIFNNRIEIYAPRNFTDAAKLLPDLNDPINIFNNFVKNTLGEEFFFNTVSDFYRIENSEDPPTRKALCSFNHKRNSIYLRNVFNLAMKEANLYKKSANYFTVTEMIKELNY